LIAADARLASSLPAHLAPKAILLGLDPLLVTDGTWFDFIHAVDVDPDWHWLLYSQLLKGESNWDEVRGLMFPFLVGEAAHVTDGLLWDRLLSKLVVRGDAFDTISRLQQSGYLIGILSGSIDVLVREVACRLGVADWFANTRIVFDEQQRVQDVRYVQAEAEKKLMQAESFLRRHRLRPEECLVIGHSQAEELLFSYIPGVALGEADRCLEPLAVDHIKHLARLPQLVSSLRRPAGVGENHQLRQQVVSEKLLTPSEFQHFLKSSSAR